MRERVLGETGRVLGETGRVLGVGPYLVIEDHVHLEGWKHDNSDTGARAKHGSGCHGYYGAMPRTCTCNWQCLDV